MSLKKSDKVRVRGTEITGNVLNIENRRVNSRNHVQFVTVRLEDGNQMEYDISEVKKLN